MANTLISSDVTTFFDTCVPFFSPFTKSISFTIFNTDITLSCVTWGMIIAFIAIILFVQKIDGVKDLLGVD